MDADKVAIVELLNRYLLAVDGHEPEPWVALFTEDGTFENPPQPVARGHDGLFDFIRGWHASGITATIHHFMGTWAIGAAGDRATAHSYYWAAEVQGSPRVVATGVFEDELSKAGGIWRFARRVHRLDSGFLSAQQAAGAPADGGRR